jgi:hypothetical protein
VGKVEPGDIHASINHFYEHVDFSAGWAEGADDLGSALGDVN